MNTEKQEVYPNFLARPAVGVEKRTFTPSRGALPKWLASIADKALEKMRTMSEEERRLWDMNVSLKQENRRLVAENEGLKKRTEEQATDLAVKAPYAKSFRRLFLSLNKRDNARLARLFKTSLDGRHIFEDAPLFFEAIAEDLVATAEARTKDHARDIANGTRGGNTKAENARRKAATKREYLTEKNAPRRAALEAFRATSPPLHSSRSCIRTFGSHRRTICRCREEVAATDGRSKSNPFLCSGTARASSGWEIGRKGGRRP